MFDKLNKELENIVPDEEVKENIKARMEIAKNQKPLLRRIISGIKIDKKHIRWTAATAIMLLVSFVSVFFFRTYDIAKQPTNETSSKTSSNQAYKVSDKDLSYRKLYNFFATAYEEQTYYDVDGAEGETGTMDIADYSTDGTLKGSTSDNADTEVIEDAEEDYSQTNTQVKGVDEADIVKTDGKYIYTLNKSNEGVYVTSADKGKLENVLIIKLEKDDNKNDKDIGFRDMYLNDGRLIVIASDYLQNKCYVYTFDVSDLENVKRLSLLSQDGYYSTSRMEDGIVYLITNKGFYEEPIEDNLKTYVPFVGLKGQETVIEPEDISNFNTTLSASDRRYAVVSSINSLYGNIIETKAVLGSSDTVYMNRRALYVTHITPPTDEDTIKTNRTDILKFSVNSGEIDVLAKDSVSGTLLNQFSMDEYDGFLRVVTTVTKYVEVTYGDSPMGLSPNHYASLQKLSDENALYILNDNLKTVGKIEDIAPGERIYSARFMEDMGYFVTYRETDPLFSVDLSDPENPEILSALKIPGFSSYLHPFGEGNLLGIGKSDSGKVKLSMFDISDPTDVTESYVETLKDVYYAPALDNHKAVLIDYQKNIIGFADYDSRYYIYSFDEEKGFIKVATLPASYSNENTRGIYIGDVFYLCCDKGITSYDIKTFISIDKVYF